MIEALKKCPMSNPLISLLEQQLGNGNLMETLAKQVGANDTAKTQNAANGIVTALMGAMAKNAASPEGAGALAKALDRDHDGSILDDLAGMLTGAGQPQNAKALNGTGIVGHLLGDRQDGVVEMVSKLSGMDKGQVSSLMVKLAPMLMGALGKTKKEQGLDVGGLVSLLQGTVADQKQKGSPVMKMVTAMLDKDGDGSIVDDIVESAGKGLLSKLFGKKK